MPDIERKLFHLRNGLLSFCPSSQGTVLKGFDPIPEELCRRFRRLKEEAAWALSRTAEARLTGWTLHPTATWYMHNFSLKAKQTLNSLQYHEL